MFFWLSVLSKIDPTKTILLLKPELTQCASLNIFCRDEERKKRGAWSEEEDEKLRQIVKEYLEAKAQAEAEDAAVTGIDPGEQIDRRHILDGVNWAVVSQVRSTDFQIASIFKSFHLFTLPLA